MASFGLSAHDGSSTGHESAIDAGAFRAPNDSEERIMQTITTVGLEVAKSVFQVHGVDADGNAARLQGTFGRHPPRANLLWIAR